MTSSSSIHLDLQSEAKTVMCSRKIVTLLLSSYSSKALSSYRQIRRKYREQVWRLEQKVAAMMESHLNQSEAPKPAGEDPEWRREETVL